MAKRKLVELNSVIQVCPDCGKIDVYKNDGHTCDRNFQNMRMHNDEYYD